MQDNHFMCRLLACLPSRRPLAGSARIPEHLSGSHLSQISHLPLAFSLSRALCVLLTISFALAQVEPKLICENKLSSQMSSVFSPTRFCAKKKNKKTKWVSWTRELPAKRHSICTHVWPHGMRLGPFQLHQPQH